MAEVVNGLNISEISGYVDQNSFDILGRAILGSSLSEAVTLRPGLQGNRVAVPLFSDDFSVSDQTCGWAGGTGSIIEQVFMDIYHGQIQRDYCPQVLSDTFLADSLKSGSGINGANTQLPQEELFADYFVKQMSKYTEQYLIGGQVSGAGLTYSGIQKQLVDAESGAYAPVIGQYDGFVWDARTAAELEAQGLTATHVNALTGAMAMFADQPFENALKSDQILVVNPADYKSLVSSLIKSNLYHYNPGNDVMAGVVIPGTGIKVVPTVGISEETDHKNFRFLTTSSNIIMGTNLTTDADNVSVWYSRDYNQVKLAASFSIGVLVVEPNLCLTENAN